MKAILFDLDGTLINSLGDLADACNHVLKQNGYEPHPEEQYNYFVGNGMDKLIWAILPEGSTEEAFQKIREQYKSYYLAHSLDRTRPYEGIQETLKQLKEQGFLLAVVSNKPDEQSQKVVKALFEPGLFDLVAGNRPGLPVKPDPALPREVLNRLGADPDKSYFVGDSGVDMKTALNCGLKSIGVTWGFRTEEELRQSGASHIVCRPSQLLDVVKR
ncbi:HAD family hydrolase [Solibaculum mannosilyticum]|uniref:HAD family hydrolase n=1 Tax=Solibaculum mannosilyticum TaxID=2780922 RepID=UPI0007A823D1|nr:Phosphoglycolate phosphatase [Eubacteriaceae bacterium CHKCI005]